MKDIGAVKTRTTITLALVFLYGVALLRPVLPLIDYFIKLDVYLEQCINKTKPQLHCNGQCILMQKIKALNTGNRADAPPTPVKVNLLEYPIGFMEVECIAEPVLRSSRISRHLSIIFFEYAVCHEIFHPPSARS